MATLEVAGITFYDRRQTDGFGFYFSDLTDWDGVPESKSPVNERPQGDGAFGIAEDLRQSAAVSFTGFYSGSSRVDMLTRKQEMTGALGVGRPVTATFTDELGPTSRIVSIRNAKPADTKGRDVVQFTVDMIATDPLRYGPSVAVSTTLPTSGGGIAYPITYPLTYGTPGYPGRITVSNPGTADTYSLLEVTGGLAGGFELTEVTTGQVIRFERPIPVGSTVYLNPRTGRASIDGQSDVSGFLTRSEWWAVPAGGSREIQFNSLGVVTGAPTLVSRTSPAYW